MRGAEVVFLNSSNMLVALIILHWLLLSEMLLEKMAYVTDSGCGRKLYKMA